MNKNNQLRADHLPVYEKGLEFAVDHVLLHLGDVVRHVVDDVHVQIVWCHAELFSKRLQHAKR